LSGIGDLVAALQRVGGVEVLHHQGVLDLGGLLQQDLRLVQRGLPRLQVGQLDRRRSGTGLGRLREIIRDDQGRQAARVVERVLVPSELRGRAD
jgi:hypothetical protein